MYLNFWMTWLQVSFLPSPNLAGVSISVTATSVATGLMFPGLGWWCYANYHLLYGMNCFLGGGGVCRPFRVRVEHRPVDAAPNRPLEVLGVMGLFGEPGEDVPSFHVHGCVEAGVPLVKLTSTCRPMVPTGTLRLQILRSHIMRRFMSCWSSP